METRVYTSRSPDKGGTSGSTVRWKGVSGRTSTRDEGRIPRPRRGAWGSDRRREVTVSSHRTREDGTKDREEVREG